MGHHLGSPGARLLLPEVQSCVDATRILTAWQGWATHGARVGASHQDGVARGHTCTSFIISWRMRMRLVLRFRAHQTVPIASHVRLRLASDVTCDA